MGTNIVGTQLPCTSWVPGTVVSGMAQGVALSRERAYGHLKQMTPDAFRPSRPRPRERSRLPDTA